MDDKKTGRDLTVRELEQGLLRVFPREDAAPWDRTGLQVGDPDAHVARVAVALDPTVDAIREARARGCNVLVTHHPPFLDALDAFLPGASPLAASGAGVYAAASSGVALMNFHTALDFNPKGYGVLPRMLGLTVERLLDELGGSAGENGYGCLCTLPDATHPATLGAFAASVRDAFGSPVQVWGDLASPVRTVVTGQGSAGSLCAACLKAEADCLVCGEIKYHAALDLERAGVSIVVLGHDVSENPFIDVLFREIVFLGVAEQDVECIRTTNWSVV